jgi:peptidoglycan hydrolase-like protein with peptidoglycan-binding domain
MAIIHTVDKPLGKSNTGVLTMTKKILCMFFLLSIIIGNKTCVANNNYGDGIYSSNIYNIGEISVVTPTQETTVPSVTYSNTSFTYQARIEYLKELYKKNGLICPPQLCPILTDEEKYNSKVLNSNLLNKWLNEFFPMTLGDNNKNVQQLQIFLNSYGYILNSFGPGSEGHETITFGQLTKKSLQRFQAKNGLETDGVFGSTTANVIRNIILGRNNKFKYKRTLSLNETGYDVLELQKFLNDHGFVIATTNEGSPGFETGKFGQLTKNALRKFQLSIGLTATGNFGPATMKYLNNN